MYRQRLGKLSKQVFISLKMETAKTIFKTKNRASIGLFDRSLSIAPQKIQYMQNLNILPRTIL